jgi:hypothetical protein
VHPTHRRRSATLFARGSVRADVGTVGPPKIGGVAPRSGWANCSTTSGTNIIFTPWPVSPFVDHDNDHGHGDH